MSNAERQKRYRERQRSAARLNSYWDAAAHGALGRLARHHGLTRRATLEALVLEAEEALLSGKPLNERQSYYNGGG